MHAYTPTSVAVAFASALMLLTTLVGGAFLARFKPGAGAVSAAWLLVLTTTFGVERVCALQPPGFRMLAIIGVLLWGMKSVVYAQARRAKAPPLSLGAWLCWVTLWPGMQPQPFADLRLAARSKSLDGARELLLGGARNLLCSAIFILVARWIYQSTGSAWAATPPMLVGLSLGLHFGVFHLCAGLWRNFGVNVRAVFRAPLKSSSLGEFWGKRWNLAFAEMSAIGVYRPLQTRFGERAALVGAFACSGLLHETAISVPARQGFGWPMLYFALHGVLVVVERVLAKRGHPVRGVWGRAWTLFWLLLPLPILFHRPFLEGVVWPLLT